MASTGLSGVAIATRSIKVPGGGEFAVRGLSFSDLTGLYQLHGGELGLWFERFVGDAANAVAGDSIADAVASIISAAPDLAAAAIALAADAEDGELDIVKRLPLGVQIDALSAVGELTFTEDMPPKKVLEIVIRMATGLVGQATPPLGAGTT